MVQFRLWYASMQVLQDSFPYPAIYYKKNINQRAVVPGSNGAAYHAFTQPAR
jgi:hypothetical protein